MLTQEGIVVSHCIDRRSTGFARGSPTVSIKIERVEVNSTTWNCSNESLKSWGSRSASDVVRWQRVPYFTEDRHHRGMRWQQDIERYSKLTDRNLDFCPIWYFFIWNIINCTSLLNNLKTNIWRLREPINNLYI